VGEGEPALRQLRRTLLPLALLAFALGAGPARARSEESGAAKPEPASPPPTLRELLPPAPVTPAATPSEPEQPWRPPAFVPGQKKVKDWLLLDSGELIRGQIEYILDEEVHFDSDELDDLDIDWDDIAGFHSPRYNTYRFNDRDIVTGTAAMHGGVIRVDTGTEIVEFPRDALFSMIEGERSELNYWSLDIDVGLTLRSGNSDQSDLSTDIEIERESPITKGTIAYQNAYSVVDGEDITNNHRLAGIFQVYVSQRTFLLAPLAEAYRDRIQNIDIRATLGGGVGYDVIDEKKVEWEVVGGAGYQRTDFSTVEIGEPDSADDAALIFRTKLETDPFRDVDWDTEYQLLMIVTDFDKTSQHLESELSVEIWGPLDFDLTFTWDRIQAPVADADGEVPESDDYRLTVGLSIEFD
jgi:hypothetical protein